MAISSVSSTWSTMGFFPALLFFQIMLGIHTYSHLSRMALIQMLNDVDWSSFVVFV